MHKHCLNRRLRPQQEPWRIDTYFCVRVQNRLTPERSALIVMTSPSSDGASLLAPLNQSTLLFRRELRNFLHPDTLPISVDAVN